jgi:hypothetical protein
MKPENLKSTCDGLHPGTIKQAYVRHSFLSDWQEQDGCPGATFKTGGVTSSSNHLES